MLKLIRKEINTKIIITPSNREETTHILETFESDEDIDKIIKKYDLLDNSGPDFSWGIDDINIDDINIAYETRYNTKDDINYIHFLRETKNNIIYWCVNSNIINIIPSSVQIEELEHQYKQYQRNIKLKNILYENQ